MITWVSLFVQKLPTCLVVVRMGWGLLSKDRHMVAGKGGIEKYQVALIWMTPLCNTFQISF